MSSTFSTMPSFVFTSESVTEGHPDKMCDQVSDAVLDALVGQDPRSRVACETTATTGLLFVTGEITTEGYADISRIAREVVKEIGYDHGYLGFDYRTCGVLTLIKSQSPDIAGGVNHSLEEREGHVSDEEVASLGAGDQGMMIGFACRETPELMPLPIALAHALARRLAAVRKAGTLPYLRPDGKTQVTVQYEHGRPVRVNAVLVSTQHAEEADPPQIERDIIEQVIHPVVPTQYLENTRYLVNPSGRFVLGGPEADAGLTGRKIIVDTYGGMGRHGGGAFSGKDPSKVDRSAAYAGRWVAKHVVASGAADRCEVQLAYAIGMAQPMSILVETFGTSHVDPAIIEAAVRSVFDLRPGAIVRDLDLKRPIYKRSAAYGHFGRAGFPWEELSRLDEFKSAVGV